MKEILNNGFLKIGDAILDTDRTARKGFPEVILADGKKTEEVISLLQGLARDDLSIASRVSFDMVDKLYNAFDKGIYHEKSRIFVANPAVNQQQKYSTKIAVVCAGLSDLAVAEEAACLLDYAGYPIEKIYDVGVAAIQRLFAHLDKLKQCDVIIVAAGMDGALPSVIAGLMPQPVVALPTGVGYGVAEGGSAALNTMLSSCAPGIAVVNIGNGYGAAMMAHAICLRIHQGKRNE